MATNRNKWGIDEAYFVAIGQINIAFQRLEWGLGYTVYLLSGSEKTIAEHVKAKPSVKLASIAALYESRTKQFGHRHDKLPALFDRAHEAGVEANNARNAIIHAHWGFNASRI